MKQAWHTTIFKLPVWGPFSSTSLEPQQYIGIAPIGLAAMGKITLEELNILLVWETYDCIEHSTTKYVPVIKQHHWLTTCSIYAPTYCAE